MGACECNNPMDFGYELNSSDKKKDKENEEENGFEYYPNTKIIKNEQENEYIENKNFKNVYEINENQENHDYNNEKNYDYSIENNKDEQGEGVNALKARIENNEENNIENNNMNYIFTTTEEKPQDDFSEYIFDNINKIREDPTSFIKIIEQAKKNIVLDKKGIYIYKSNVKVALYRGESAFDETINYLKKLKPMKRLIFSNELLIDTPINEEQIQDKKYMNEQISLKVQNGIPIKSFWRDIIKDSQTCLILMIVDDTGANSGKKRNDILDPNMQCIGIVSKKIGKSFASYITLC